MKNINLVLKHITTGLTNYSVPLFYPLEDWTVAQIYLLKWVLTIFWMIYFWTLSFFTLRVYFKPRGISVRAINYVYLILFGLAGILYVTGWVFGIGNTMYHIVRTLTGLTNSFMPVLIVFLFLNYFPKEAEN
nr:hypothetical protein [Putridiphycobacter roseus]